MNSKEALSMGHGMQSVVNRQIALIADKIRPGDASFHKNLAGKLNPYNPSRHLSVEDIVDILRTMPQGQKVPFANAFLVHAGMGAFMLPDPGNIGQQIILELTLRVGIALGNYNAVVVAAVDPAGPGGSDITIDEAESLISAAITVLQASNELASAMESLRQKMARQTVVVSAGGGL